MKKPEASTKAGTAKSLKAGNGTARPPKVSKNQIDRPLDAGNVDPEHLVFGWDKRDAHSRKPYPDEDVAVRAHGLRIGAAYRKTVEAVIETGRLLNAARNALGHGKWLKVYQYLPFGQRQGQMLMRIAEHPVLSDPQHVADLPASWATLYELSGIEADLVKERIAAGEINAAMTRKQAKVMCASLDYPAMHDAEATLQKLYLFSTHVAPGDLVDYWQRGGEEFEDGSVSVNKEQLQRLRNFAKWVNELADRLAERDAGEYTEQRCEHPLGRERAVAEREAAGEREAAA